MGIEDYMNFYNEINGLYYQNHSLFKIVVYEGVHVNSEKVSKSIELVIWARMIHHWAFTANEKLPSTCIRRVRELMEFFDGSYEPLLEKDKRPRIEKVVADPPSGAIRFLYTKKVYRLFKWITRMTDIELTTWSQDVLSKFNECMVN